MKKIIYLLAAVTVLSLLITGCNENSEGSSDTTADTAVVEANPASDFEYTENEDGEIVIDRYIGTDNEIVVPQTIDGKTVTEIGSNSFAYNKKIVSVVIPDTVEIISPAAFKLCAELTTVNLPEGLIEIGPGAFEECVKVSGITLPSGLTELGYRAFYNCKALTHINIPKGLVGKSSTEVGGWQGETFASSGLESIEFEEGVTSIAAAAFVGTNITEVVLPSSVQSIYESAFFGCSKLTSVELPESLTTLGARAFESCETLKHISIPKSVSEWGERVFASSGLETIDLEDGLQSIGEGAFYGTKLKSVEIPASVTDVPDSAFEDCRNLQKITHE